MRFSVARASDAASMDVKALWKAAKRHDAARVKQLIVASNEATRSLAIVDAFHARKGTTPLMVACQKSDVTHRHREYSAALTVQVLLEFGADPALTDQRKDGNTALHFAAAANQWRSIEFLLHAGADPFALNRHGHAPIDLARWSRRSDALDTLTQHTRIRSGWLYVRKAPSGGLRLWKKRFVMALACDAARETIELSIYKDRHDQRPSAVLLLRNGQHAMVASPKKGWLDKRNMFRVDRPMVVQRMRTKRRFSRDAHAQRESESAGDTHEYQFASDSAEERDAWMALLRGGSVTAVPVDARFPEPTGFMTPQSGMAIDRDVLSPLLPPPRAIVDSTPLSPNDGVLFPLPPSPSSFPPSPPSTTSRAATPSAPTFIEEFDAMSFESPQSMPPPPLSTVTRRESDALAAPEQRSECVICMDATRDAICVPCGHVAGCHACLVRHMQQLRSCPICRGHVQSVVKIYEC